MSMTKALEGSELAAKHKWTPEERDEVDTAIRIVASGNSTFTADEIWEQLGPDFPVTKGLTARLTAAARRGDILNTGAIVFAERGGEHDHSQRLSVWSSTLC